VTSAPQSCVFGAACYARWPRRACRPRSTHGGAPRPAKITSPNTACSPARAWKASPVQCSRVANTPSDHGTPARREFRPVVGAGAALIRWRCGAGGKRSASSWIPTRTNPSTDPAPA